MSGSIDRHQQLLALLSAEIFRQRRIVADTNVEGGSNPDRTDDRRKLAVQNITRLINIRETLEILFAEDEAGVPF